MRKVTPTANKSHYSICAIAKVRTPERRAQWAEIKKVGLSGTYATRESAEAALAERQSELSFIPEICEGFFM